LIHTDAPEPALTLEALRQVLNSALLNGTVRFSRWHGTARSEERDITFDDAVHIICTTGTYKCAPRYENENWIYEVIGKDLDGELATVPIAVDNEKYRVTIITSY